MKTIGELLNEHKQETIKVIPKKEVISLIAGLVNLSPDRLKNWKIVAFKLRGLSAQDMTTIFYSVRKGMRTDTANKTGQFLYITEAIKRPKKPKQSKLFK